MSNAVWRWTRSFGRLFIGMISIFRLLINLFIKSSSPLNFHFQVKEIDPDNKENNEQIKKCEKKGVALKAKKEEKKKKSDDSDSDSDDE